MKKLMISFVAVACVLTLSGFTFANTRGDMDCDGLIGLAEAIISLQILSGAEPAENLSTPCGVAALGYIEWHGAGVDYRGTVTAQIPGCTQDANGVFWDFNECKKICDRLGPGGQNCDGMCNNINAETTTNEMTLCTIEATIIEPQTGNIELGRVELSSICGGLTAVGTVASSLQGCRQDDIGVYWDHTSCLDDCARLAAGGLNCRSACNFMNADTSKDETLYCTY